MNKTTIIIAVIIIIIILLLVYFKYIKKKPTPEELEQKAIEIRAEVAGNNYSSFMATRASGL
jgi:preprotein translocase subunit SecG